MQLADRDLAEIVHAQRDAAIPIPDDEEIRKRLRAAIIEIVPNKWALRGTLFRLIDRAPPAALYAMRDKMRELFV